MERSSAGPGLLGTRATLVGQRIPAGGGGVLRLFSEAPMNARPRIYLAGPLGFSEAGRYFHRTVLVPFVVGLGYDVLDPWAFTDPRKIQAIEKMPRGPGRCEAWRELNRKIGAANRAAIDRADGVVAILDGPDVDSGTSAEIGYAFARGKFIVGYRGDFRLSADNEGGTVNLQVEFFIRESGGTIVARYEDLKRSLEPLRSRGPTAARPQRSGASPAARSRSGGGLP